MWLLCWTLVGSVWAATSEGEKLEALARSRDPTLELEAMAVLQSALANGDTRVEALASFHLAQVDLQQGRLALAMQRAEHAERIFAELGESFDVGRARRRQGDIWSRLEDASAAVERLTSAGAAFRAAAGIVPETDIELQLAHLDAAIGNALRERSPEVAREHYQEALRRYRTLDFAAGVDGVQANLGTVAQTLGDLLGADALFAAAEQGARERRDDYLRSIVLANRAAVANLRQDYERALELAQSSLELARDDNRSTGILTALLRIAQAQRGLGDADAALESLRAAIATFGDAPPPDLSAEILAEAIALLRAQGELAEALDLSERRAALRAPRGDEAMLGFWRARFESERKDAEILQMAHKHAQQSVLMVAVALVALMALGLLAMLLARHRLAETARRIEHEQNTRLQSALADVERLSRTDGLTGLCNRRAAELWWLDNASAGTVLALADIDHFKAINDAQGHAVGDLVLKKVADALTAAVGDGLAARWGGEEFLLGFSDEARARDALDRIVPALATTSALPNLVQLTIGVARRRPDETLGELVRRADAALYAGKNSGRNRTVWA